MTKPAAKPPILYVTLSLARGGTENHLCEIAPRLAARGWPVTIYCLLGGGPLAEGLAGRGVTVITGKTMVSHRRMPNAVRALAAGPHLFTILRGLRPRIVHFFLPAAYLVGAPLSVLARTPIRIMSRRSQNDYQHGRPLSARLERSLHRRMTAILGNSKRLVDELVESENCPAEKVGLIYNGVDLDRFERRDQRKATRTSLGLGEQDLVVIAVANLIPYKGHEDLLRGLALVQNTIPSPWTLLCVGRDDGIGADLKKLSCELGIGPNVRFLGSRADVPDLLGAADLSVLASSANEGFSNAVLESMAAGLPMVVTDVGGNAEAVVDGTTGYVVPPNNPAALGNAVETIARDHGLAQNMGSAARARAVELFSMDGCIAAYERVYAGLGEGLDAAQLAPTRFEASG